MYDLTGGVNVIKIDIFSFSFLVFFLKYLILIY